MSKFWPYYSLYKCWRREKSEDRTLSRGRSNNREEYRRHSSVPPSRTYQPIGKELEDDTVMHKIMKRNGRYTMTFQAGYLLLDLIQAESGMPFMRVRSRVEGSDMFLFSSSRVQGFFKLRQCSDLSAFYHKRINRSWQRVEDQVFVGVRMDEQIWLVHLRSGCLEKCLSPASDV